MKTLWKIPVPSSADLRPELELQPYRTLVLTFAADEDHTSRVTMTFRGVIAYRVWFLDSLTSGLLDAYDKLIDVGESDWLAGGRKTNSHTPGTLRHLRILFDDGPCYEFLCTSVELPTLPTQQE